MKQLASEHNKYQQRFDSYFEEQFLVRLQSAQFSYSRAEQTIKFTELTNALLQLNRECFTIHRIVSNNVNLCQEG